MYSEALYIVVETVVCGLGAKLVISLAVVRGRSAGRGTVARYILLVSHLAKGTVQ